MKNKLTLLIDGNWLLQSRFSVMMDQFNKNYDESLRIAASTELQDRMARSINVIINKLPEIDNIIMITDGGSWRKKLEVPTQLQTTYKGNRIKDDTIDWDQIYKALNRISNKCKEAGITTCNYLNSEGDDWMWYWSRRLNSEGINCIIWSSDCDLKQLVQVDNGAFTGWYNDKKGLFLHNSLKKEEVSDIDFFLLPYTESSLIDKLEQHTNIEYIDPNDVILHKIICGDASDNIKSIIRYQKNGRNYGIGIKEWLKIQKALNINNIEDFNNKELDIVNYFNSQSKYANIVNKEDLLEMIHYNRRLVWLSENVIPDTIIQVMNQSEYKIYDLSYIRNNYKILAEEESDITNIFENISLDVPF